MFNYLGFGLGLRTQHYQQIATTLPLEIDWFEIITENFLIAGGKPFYYLDCIREQYPIAMHGVSMSIGSADDLDWNYLAQVKKLANNIQAAWISDHLCWTGLNKVNTHDLLPLPYTEESLKHVIQQIKLVQDYLEQPIVLENISSYVEFDESCMPEWEFITEVCNQSSCLLLLDVNNVYVNSVNHNFNPLTYIDNIPLEKVQQLHLAGHLDKGDYIIDTHDQQIVDQVWQLYKYVVKHSQNHPISLIIERDDNIPDLAKMITELNIAKSIASLPTFELSCELA